MAAFDRMKYVESHVPSEGNKYTFTGNCGCCNQKMSVSVKGSDLFAYRQGALIQNAFPYLTDGEREFMMSATCERCFDRMFPEEEEDD